MSISDYFNKKVVTQKSLEAVTASVESPDLIKEIDKRNKTYYPNVNFADPSNFVHFGSAKEYYEGSIKRIYQQYPYDGSEAEKLEFDSNSTYLDQWLFKYKYPKSTGFALLSADGWGTPSSTIGKYGLPNNKEYIFSAGGMHSASITQHENQDDPIGNHPLKDVFELGVKYDTDKNRTINYRMNMTEGITIQFWLKKDAFTTAGTDKEVILDLWNGNEQGEHNYGRLTLELSGGLNSPTPTATMFLTLMSGTFGISNQAICETTYNAAAVANGQWQHHTIAVKAANSNLNVNYYNNGLLNKASSFSTTRNLLDVPNNINGYIGCLQTASFADHSSYHQTSMLGAGKLSASMDDFRFWKTSLDNEYVYNTWYYPVGGGSNTDDYRTNLGVYYKFNEGITGTSSVDSVVLDYSGRIANGVWYKQTGFSSNVTRNTGSAFSAAGVLAYEPGDPIIRSTHHLVQNLLTEMESSGSLYDRTNSAYLYDSLPGWIREEDEKNDNIKYLYQILSSYLDTLYVQISELPKLKDKNYFSASADPYPFVDKFLNDRGLLTPNSFVDSSVLEYFWDRNEHGVHYEQTIEKTKRLIYNNIYNNLDYILKSKGTEKSFRNLLRCYGIDDELVKLNVYTDNGKHYIKDRYKNSSIKTKVLNLNNASRTGGTITQTSSSLNPRTFISGSGDEQLEKFSAFSMEAGVIFPKGKKLEETGYFLPQISASLFGFNQAVSGANEHYGWNVPNDANLQVYAVRAARDSDRVKFVFKNQDDSIYAESDFIEEVYNAERWNFQLSVKPTGYPFIGNEAFSGEPTYEIELYGVTHNLGDIRNQFAIAYTASHAVGVDIMTQPKRVFVGAHRQDFTGSVISQCDVMFDSCRVWMDELEKNSIIQHNLDPMNYGHDKIYNATTLFNNTISSSVHIPGADSLILHWNFDQNAAADVTGSFIVEDFSSGSNSDMYSWASNIVEREHKGRGIGFPNNDPNAVKSEFIFARRKELPEISFTDNRIKIMDKENELFIEDEDTTDNIFALEKSMYQTISEEMIRTFSTMKEYSNLFAKPVDHYRADYKRLRKAREMFFNRVETDTDLDRYVEYFKWIDSSLSFFIEQLKPASVSFTKGISDVVESHIFERPKYARKFPTVKTITATQGTAKGLGELSYNWKFGHSPEYKGGGDNTHCLWQRERRERTGALSTQRQAINDTILTNAQSYNVYLGDNEKNVYLRPTYVTKRFGRPYRLDMDLNTSLHGGTNYNIQKNREFVYNVTRPHGSKTNIGIPVNVFVVGVGPGQGITETRMCDDEESPTQLKKFDFTMTAGKDSSLDGLAPASASLDYVYQVKGHYAAPFTLISGTMPHGANRKISQGYTSSAIVTNLHSDTTYFENDIPMQGPFSETWMGGHQSRHVEMNRYDESLISSGGVATRNYLDDEYTRPEAFRILVGEHPDETNQDGALGFVGPDYGGPYPDTSRQWAIHYRGMRAKTPYTFGNVSGSERMLGNYNRRYEYFNTVGRLENNNRLKKAASDADYQLSGTFLPSHIQEALPATTNPISLVGAYPLNLGNVFGGESNRINAVNQILRPAIAASGSFTATGSTLYQAPYSASFDIQSIPHAGTHQAYKFAVTGATDFYEIYTASFGVQGVPHAGAHQTYYFESEEETSNITYNNYVGSFDIQPPPTAPQSPALSWFVKSTSTLSDGHTLRLTASTIDKLIEVDTNNSVRGDTDIIVSTKRKALQGASSQGIARGQYLDIGTGTFSISFWFNNINSDSSTQTQILFLDGGTGKHRFNIDNNIACEIYSNSGGVGFTNFNASTAVTYGNQWIHIVFVFNGVTSAPTMYLNNAEVTPSGVATSGTGNPDIDGFYLYLDDLMAMQDITIWDTALGLSDAQELYNNGVWRSPTAHSNNSNIIAYFPFGEEDSLRAIGYEIGDSLDDQGQGNSTKILNKTYGSDSNARITIQYYPSEFTFVEGTPNSNDGIWDNLKTDLNAAFTGWTANYASGSDKAQFFLRRDTAGVSNTWGLYSSNTNSFSFPATYATMGSSSVASNLSDGDTISVSGSTFTVRHTSTGSVSYAADEDFHVGSEYRRAFSWPVRDSNGNQMYLYSDAYADPTSNNVSISFWGYNMNVTNDCNLFNSFSSAGIGIQMWRDEDDFWIRFWNGGSPNYRQYLATACLVQDEFHHFTITFNKADMTVVPTLYIDGAPVSMAAYGASPGSGTGAARDIEEIYIGDWTADDPLYEWQGLLSDFVIWNTGLTEEDAQILTNSGSWLDLTAHPKAHYIWDWWTFGHDPGNNYSTTGKLSAVSVTSIPPTIGKHTLSLGPDAGDDIFQGPYGILRTSKAASDWYSHVATQVENATNYTASNSSNTIQINTHAYSVPTADSFANSNNSFTNESAIAFDAFAFDNYVAGATSGSYIEIQDKKFYVSTGSVPATYASSGTERVLVNSTSSNWPVYLRDAIQEHLPEYTASYYTLNNDYHFFVRSGQLGAKGDNTLAQGGTTFSNLGKVLGNAASASSTLADGDTISIESDVFTTRYTTYGNAATDFTVGTTYRKALTWPSTDISNVSIRNTSYGAPDDATAVTISFWLKASSENGYVATLGGSQLSNAAITIVNGTSNLSFYVGNGSSYDLAFYPSISNDKWNQYTFKVAKNLGTDPELWINGVAQSLHSGWSSPGGTLDTINSIYLGDYVAVPGATNEFQGSMQDFVLWNTGLNLQDAVVLYNSGSWLDIHTHPKASSIWDWWLLGEEAGMPDVGNTLLSAGVSSIAPTIGRHTLSVVSNGNVQATTGVVENKKTTAGFKTHIASVVAARNTEYNTYVSSVNLEITSAFTTYGGTFTEQGETYTIDGPIVLARYGNYHTGAVDENQIEFEGKTFVVTASTNPSGAYETYGNEVHVFSHQPDNATWWNNLSSAIEATLPQMTASYFEYDGEAHFFVRSGSAADSAHTTIQETGTSFSALHMVSGSAISGSSTLADQDTLTIVDNTGTHVFTVGHTTSGSTDINTGATFRKALRFKDKGSNNLNHAKNVSYTNPTSTDYLSVSWWMQIPDIDNSQDRIWEFDHGSGNHSFASTINQNFYIYFYDTGGSNAVAYESSNTLYNSGDVGVWKHYTIVFSRTNVDAETPLFYVNGQPATLSRTISNTFSNTNVVPITEVYIGDDDEQSGTVQQNKALQDFVIWDTQLAEVDAQILYNSGSWLDIHSHPKANLIWDWWMLGNEPEITQEFDSALSSTTNGAAVTTIAPTIGRHSLTFSDNTQVVVTSGSMEIGKTNAAFWAEMTQSVKDTSEFDQSYTVSSTATQYNVTASTAVTGALMAVGSGDSLPTVQASFAESGTTFGVTRQVFRGTEQLIQRYANAGANPDDFFIIGPNFTTEESGSTVFVTDVSGGIASTSAPYYTKVAPKNTRALEWFSTGTQRNSLFNSSYTNPSSNLISISFWMSLNSTSVSARIVDSPSFILDAYQSDKMKISLKDSGGDISDYTFDRFSGTGIKHYTIIIDTTDVDTLPIVYRDGEALSVTAGDQDGTGAMANITSIYIGDGMNTSTSNEHQGKLQDFVVWNTGLNSEDARILFNDGFWYDIRLHASASSIHDWWMLGAEKDIAVLSNGQNIYTSGITSIAPRIGSHSLTVYLNAYIKTTTSGVPDKNTYYYILSSASSDDEYWLRISGAIYDAYNEYSIVSSSGTPNPTLFSVTGGLEVGGINVFDTDHIHNRALTIYGTSFANPVGINGGFDQVQQNDTINVIEKESDFLSGSERNKTVITSRFSAPGGIEVQTYGYLDAYAREYSVHNHLNYRNLTIRGSGSGENGTIRVDSQVSSRDGLRALYQRPMGKAGTDSVYGSVNSSDYDYNASFGKIHSNTLVTPRSGSSDVEIVEKNNNLNYQSIIPSSDYNYSWATSSLGDNYSVRSGTQKVFGYWPKDGLNKVNGVLDSAITFPTSSDIYATYGE